MILNTINIFMPLVQWSFYIGSSGFILYVMYKFYKKELEQAARVLFKYKITLISFIVVFLVLRLGLTYLTNWLPISWLPTLAFPLAFGLVYFYQFYGDD